MPGNMVRACSSPVHTHISIPRRSLPCPRHRPSQLCFLWGLQRLLCQALPEPWTQQGWLWRRDCLCMFLLMWPGEEPELTTHTGEVMVAGAPASAAMALAKLPDSGKEKLPAPRPEPDCARPTGLGADNANQIAVVPAAATSWFLKH